MNNDKSTAKPTGCQGETNWTPISNEVLDTIMATLTGSALKILLAIARATWANGGVAALSYSDLRRTTNIASDATIAKGVASLLQGGLIERTTTDDEPGNLEPVSCYTLREDLMLSTTVFDVDNERCEKTVVENDAQDKKCSVDVVVIPTIDSEDKDNNKQKQKRQNVHDMAIGGQGFAKLMRTTAVLVDGESKPLDAAFTGRWLRWTREGNTDGIRNVTSFAIAQMLRGEEPPNGHRQKPGEVVRLGRPEEYRSGIVHTRNNDAFQRHLDRQKARAAIAAAGAV